MSITSSGFSSRRSAARREAPSSSSSSAMPARPLPVLRARGNEQLEQRLLGVAAVLRLVPDALAVAAEHVGGDLLAPGGREAVERRRPGRRPLGAVGGPPGGGGGPAPGPRGP